MRIEHIRSAPIQAFDHTVGTERSGFDQAVLNAQSLAKLTKFVLAGGLPGTSGKEAVDKLFAVVNA